MGWIRGWEWVVILVAILLIFGPSKIPQLAKSVGQAVTEFKKGIKSVKTEVEDAVAETKEPESSNKKTT